jgi:hypothetical protein
MEFNQDEIEIATIKSGDNLIPGKKYFINIDNDTEVVNEDNASIILYDDEDISGIYEFITRTSNSSMYKYTMYTFTDQENRQLQILYSRNIYKILMAGCLVNCDIYERVIKPTEYILK